LSYIPYYDSLLSSSLATTPPKDNFTKPTEWIMFQYLPAKLVEEEECQEMTIFVSSGFEKSNGTHPSYFWIHGRETNFKKIERENYRYNMWCDGKDKQR